MSRLQYLPDPDRLSVLAATILLAYTTTRFVDLPARDIEIQLPGLYLEFEINIRTLTGLIVAGLTATGADGLLRDHPALQGKSTLQHLLLPTLTAWVIGIPLYRLPFGPQWLVGLIIGGALLMLVLVGEYIVVDSRDERHSLASAGLTAVSFALYLILAIALRSGGDRLFLILPALTLPAGLVALRTLHLRLEGIWPYRQAITLAIIIAQLIAAFYYWPLLPVTFGLALLGPAYALTSLVGNLTDGEPLRRAVIEPSLVLIIVWGTALWTR